MKKEKLRYLFWGLLCLLLGTTLFWFGLSTFPIVLVVYAGRVFWLGLDALLTPTKDFLVPLKFNAKSWSIVVFTTYSRIVFWVYLLILGPFSAQSVGVFWVLVLALMLWDIGIGMYNAYHLLWWLKIVGGFEGTAAPPDKFVIRIHKVMEFLAICIAGYSLVTVGLDFLLSFV